MNSDHASEAKEKHRADILRTIELLTAFSQAKSLEYHQSNGEWVHALQPSPEMLARSPHLYRVKPEPKYRPWRLYEIPVGAVARRKHKGLNQVPQVIVAADYLNASTKEEQPACAIMHFEDKEHTVAENLLKNWEWKWAHEPDIAWRVCGVPE